MWQASPITAKELCHQTTLTISFSPETSAQYCEISVGYDDGQNTRKTRDSLGLQVKMLLNIQYCAKVISLYVSSKQLVFLVLFQSSSPGFLFVEVFFGRFLLFHSFSVHSVPFLEECGVSFRSSATLLKR